jgi:hypothetical protein
MGSLPDRVLASVPATSGPLALSQRFVITLTFANESIATILYGSESAAGVNKELVEVHGAGRSGRLDDYRRLDLYGSERRRTVRSRTIDKGHRPQFGAFRRLLDGEPLPGPSALDTMEVTIHAAEALRIAGDG